MSSLEVAWASSSRVSRSGEGALKQNLALSLMFLQSEALFGTEIQRRLGAKGERGEGR